MITLTMLDGACAEQKDTWQKEWPNGMAVTEENIRKAQELNLNINWFVNNKFSVEQRAEYERLRDAAYAEHHRIYSAAHTEFNRICDAVWTECNCDAYARIRDTAFAECNRVYDITWTEYEYACITAFVAAWRNK